MPQLDVLRLFAFLSVFLVHALPSVDAATHRGLGHSVALVERAIQTSGANGVALFFVLSSFLITRLLLLEREKTGSVHLRSFYLRRLLRIWPLYYFVVLLSLVFPLFIPTERLSTHRLLAASFFYMNWNVALHGFTWNPIYPLWTVSCEEQFYGVWPMLIRFVPSRRMASVCLGVITFILLLSFWPGGLSQRLGIASFTALLAYFPLGGLLALASMKKQSSWPWRTGFLAGSTGLLCWILGSLGSATKVFGASPLLADLLCLGCAALGTVLLFNAFYRTDQIAWPLSITYLGKISFGLYVFHVPVLLAVNHLLGSTRFALNSGSGHSGTNLWHVLGVRVPLSLGLTTGLAALSYRFLETPFLRLKERFAFVHSRPMQTSPLSLDRLKPAKETPSHTLVPLG